MLTPPETKRQVINVLIQLECINTTSTVAITN